MPRHAWCEPALAAGQAARRPRPPLSAASRGNGRRPASAPPAAGCPDGPRPRRRQLRLHPAPAPPALPVQQRPARARSHGGRRGAAARAPAAARPRRPARSGPAPHRADVGELLGPHIVGTHDERLLIGVQILAQASVVLWGAGAGDAGALRRRPSLRSEAQPPPRAPGGAPAAGAAAPGRDRGRPARPPRTPAAPRLHAKGRRRRAVPSAAPPRTASFFSSLEADGILSQLQDQDWQRPSQGYLTAVERGRSRGRGTALGRRDGGARRPPRRPRSCRARGRGPRHSVQPSTRGEGSGRRSAWPAGAAAARAPLTAPPAPARPLPAFAPACMPPSSTVARPRHPGSHAAAPDCMAAAVTRPTAAAPRTPSRRARPAGSRRPPRPQ
jgi:hypothetical protein